MDWINSAKEFVLGDGLKHFVENYGLYGIAICVFAETAFFFAFFLPGESLLVTAAIFAANGTLNVWELCLVVFVASSLGCQVGYFIGSKMGPALRRKRDGRFFKQKYLTRADRYYARYGNRTITFSRFIPIVRSFGPLAAGVTNMPKRSFTIYNIIGGVIWSFGITLLAYVIAVRVGETIPLDKYIVPIVLVVVFISLIPAFIELRKEEHEIAEGSIEEDVSGAK